MNPEIILTSPFGLYLFLASNPELMMLAAYLTAFFASKN